MREPVQKYTRKIYRRYMEIISEKTKVSVSNGQPDVIGNIAWAEEAAEYLVWAIFGFTQNEIDEMPQAEFEHYFNEVQKMRENPLYSATSSEGSNQHWGQAVEV